MIQFFLCYKVYTSTLWKKCLGDAAKVFNPEKYFGDFSFEIIPGAPPHLPGERDLVLRCNVLRDGTAPHNSFQTPERE